MSLSQASDTPLSPDQKKRYMQVPEHLLFGLIGTIVFAIFLADWQTILGVAVWVLYIIPLTMALLAWRPIVPLLVAMAASIFMVMNFTVDASGINPGIALMNRGFGLASIWIMASVGFFFIRNKVAVQTEEWIQTAQTGLGLAVSGEKSFETMGEGALRFLAEYLEVTAASFYVLDGKKYRKIASYGVPADAAIAEFDLDDGLLGQAAKDKRIFTLKDIPDGYIQYGSSMGSAKPDTLIIFPAVAEDKTRAVIEIGFNGKTDNSTTRLLERLSEIIATAVRSAEYRANLQNFLEETQRQAEELEAQSEELRVANEELEEQSSALQESQSRLELQQAEMEQTNVQLEEQAQILESQKEDLQKHKNDLLERARELELASQYKSDFLANMSHELRTPLNSTLILAKLLADNGEDNLTPEQVRYAETIYAAGNDLLALINDILDLSKIEAGYMDIQPENLFLGKLTDGLEKAFEPIAGKKGLKFKIKVDKNCPRSITTDGKRLEQILKNLLSNAFKFTEKGGVTLSISRHEDDKKIALTVADTGIGIPEEKQAMIFEAFRQAEGTTNRQFGGTGLGLSISRELSRLLGGNIILESTPGKGSRFTLVLPLKWSEEAVVEKPAIKMGEITPSETNSKALVKKEKQDLVPLHYDGISNGIKDDRMVLKAGRHHILVIEDDPEFARILYDLAKDLKFQCLVSTSAEEGLYLCQKYSPKAILLDIGLPDSSGLAVLDRLKQDPETRHIPVHIVSGNDYTHTALSLGAVSYMLKPVKRETLVTTLKSLEQDLSSRVRRLLVVEDDAVQLESIRELFKPLNIDIVGVQTAKECLKKLKSETFDCMVLDLSLPDASGYSLLETLSNEEAYSFPPVIVYTGKDLSAKEEQQLRKYSKSIIIKGARSPERLLDEVTLFLHQIVSELPAEQQRMLKQAKNRDSILEGRRVLIVEDDMRNVYSLTSILEPRGVKVDVARNGQEALDYLDRKAPHENGEDVDIVLMDVMMPVMDGLTATRKIRQDKTWKNLPIIVLTAKAMKDDQEKCLDAGANDYMTKPLDVEKLLSLLRVWMPR